MQKIAPLLSAYLMLLALMALATGTAAQVAARIHQGITATLPYDGTSNIPASCFVAGDNCRYQDVLISLPMSEPLGDTPPPEAQSSISFSCDQVGTNPVGIWLQDWQGQWAYSPSVVVQTDNDHVCSGGLNWQTPEFQTTLGFTAAIGSEGLLTLHARDFVAGYTVYEDITPSFSFSPDPADTLLTLSCEDLGTAVYSIYMHASDSLQATHCESFVLLQDEVGVCSEGAEAPGFSAFNLLQLQLPASGELTVKVSDFLPKSAPQGLAYAFSPDRSDTLLRLDCSDYELLDGDFQPLDIYAIAEDGTYSSLKSNLFLYDSFNRCPAVSGYQPLNDNACSALPLEVGDGSCPYRLSNVGAGAETGEVSPPAGDCGDPLSWCDGGSVDNSLWFTFKAPASGSVSIEATLLNTQLALWEAEDCNALTDGSAILIAAEDQGSGGSIEARIDTVNYLIPGQTYYLQMDGHAGASGSFDLWIKDEGLQQLLMAGSPGCTEAALAPVSQGKNAWQHLANESGHLIASIADGGNALGEISSSLQVHDGMIRTDASGNPYLNRNWQISTEQAAVRPVRLRLYFTLEEFQALQGAGAGIETPWHLSLTRVPGGSCGPFGGGGQGHKQLRYGNINEQDYFIDFEIPGFSAFYLNGNNTLTSTATETPPELQMSVFPNPSRDVAQLRLQLPRAMRLNIQLVSLTGQVVQQQSQEVPKGETVWPISTEALPSGLYLLRVKSENGNSWSRRLVVE